MTSKELKNVAASVHQRLLNKAGSESRPFNEILQYYAMERFLYRLSKSTHAKCFVLKGALMLTAWSASGSRPTVDIDFLAYTKNDPEDLKLMCREVCGVNVPDDGMNYDLENMSAEIIKEDADYEGVRLRFSACLGNARVPMQLDIAFGDVVTPEVSELLYPTLLDFSAPRLRAYNRETVVAEKLEAAARLGEINTRMKDFYDIWYLSRHFAFTGKELCLACRNTFEHRKTPADDCRDLFTVAFVHDGQRQKQWDAFLKRNRIEHAPERFADAMVLIQNFLMPVVDNMAQTDFTLMWSPEKGWHS